MKMAQRWRSDWTAAASASVRTAYRVSHPYGALGSCRRRHQQQRPSGRPMWNKFATQTEDQLNPKNKKYNIKHACAQAPFTPATATRGGVSRSRIICIFAMPPSSVRTKVLRQRAYKIISAGDDRKFGRARVRERARVMCGTDKDRRSERTSASAS